MVKNLDRCSKKYCTSKNLPQSVCTGLSQMVTSNNASEIRDFCKQNQKYNSFDPTAIV